MEETLQNILKELKAQASQTKEIFNADEAADFLSVEKSYLYKLTSRNAIPFYKPTAGKLYFKRSELIAWIEASRVDTVKDIHDSVTDLLNNKISKL